jgi:hypothetical protein
MRICMYVAVPAPASPANSRMVGSLSLSTYLSIGAILYCCDCAKDAMTRSRPSSHRTQFRFRAIAWHGIALHFPIR